MDNLDIKGDTGKKKSMKVLCENVILKDTLKLHQCRRGSEHLTIKDKGSQWEGLAVQVHEDLQHLGLLADRRFSCFPTFTLQSKLQTTYSSVFTVYSTVYFTNYLLWLHCLCTHRTMWPVAHLLQGMINIIKKKKKKEGGNFIPRP